MKRLVISIVSLLFVTLVSAQQMTTINGKYKNGYSNWTELSIEWLDTETSILKR